MNISTLRDELRGCGIVDIIQCSNTNDVNFIIDNGKAFETRTISYDMLIKCKNVNDVFYLLLNPKIVHDKEFNDKFEKLIRK